MMGTSWNEVSEDGGSGDSPEFIEVSPNTYVAANEDPVYLEPDREWLEAGQLVEGGQ
jgi:hypothetical protein